MTDFDKAINHIGNQIKAYRECGINDGNQLVEHLKQISATLFFLEKHRAQVHKDWQAALNRLVLEGMSVSKAENETHVKHPEMYLLRRIMDSAYTTIDAIRTQISWIKSEKSNAN
jgi:hypothetical protein